MPNVVDQSAWWNMVEPTADLSNIGNIILTVNDLLSALGAYLIFIIFLHPL